MTAAATEEPPPIASDAPPDAPEVASEGAAAAPGAAVGAPGDAGSIAAADLNAAATDAAGVILSDADRRWLARQNIVQACLENEAKAAQELCEAALALEDAKTEFKGAQTAREAALLATMHALRDEIPTQQGTLPFDQANRPTTAPSASDAEYDAATHEWEKKWDAEFLSQSIDVLELSPALAENLRKYTPHIETLKTLMEVFGKSEGHAYTIVDGIGKAGSEKIELAYEKIRNTYLANNPAPVKPQPVDEAAPFTAGPTDYNFVDTFPPFVAETPNETFTDENHRDMIKEQTEEYRSIMESKQCLATGKHLNGETMTAKNRRNIETALGETQMQYDSGYDAYAERFGKRAAERLRGHIESQVEKRESLKGGLDG